MGNGTDEKVWHLNNGFQVDNAPQAPPRSESQYSPDIQQKLDRGEYIGDGDYHGEGLDDAQAPQVAGNKKI